MTDNLISNIDFFIRYACIGQVILLIAYLVYRKQTSYFLKIVSLLLSLGVVAYLLLTAPYSPRPQGFIRSLLLMLTHTMPVFLWFYGKLIFEDGFRIRPLQKAVFVFLAIFYLYVFLIRGGGGHLQMLSHLIALVFILHLLFSVIITWRHDLIEQRRVARFWLVALVGLFYLMLDLVELSNTSLNRHSLFMLMNASICLTGSSVTIAMVFLYESTKERTREFSTHSSYSRLIPQENALHAKLQAFIDKAGLLQSDLSISKLAGQLDCAEHHLRKLINQRLGYNNFNAFLNHYRIEEARKRLVESPLPVLSIALDLGYGSIAPFNRAFKDIIGLTPTAYRSAQFAQNSNEITENFKND